MKAKQYASEYIAKLNHSKTEEEINHITMGLLVQLMKEGEDLKQKRHVRFDKGFIPICKELNQKWNVIADLVEKEMGMEVLKSNGYRDFLFMKVPGMKKAWSEWKS